LREVFTGEEPNVDGSWVEKTSDIDREHETPAERVCRG